MITIAWLLPLISALGGAAKSGGSGLAGGADTAGGGAGQWGTDLSLAGGQPQQQAQQQSSLFGNLFDAGQQQGPTASGVPLATATQANLLGNQTDFNAQQGSGGGLFGGLMGALGSAGPGNKGVPQLDSTFMNMPTTGQMPQGPAQTASNVLDPQTMLIQLLQQQMRQ